MMSKLSLRPVVAGLMGVLLLGVVGTAGAEGVTLSVAGDADVRSVLAGLVGKRVGLRVGSGEELTGTVSEVGEEMVVIKELSGRDFFDAAVVIDHIDAVVVRNQ